MEKSATFSLCGKYRYDLKRTWDHTLRKAIVIMLNPSIADDSKDDPTIRKISTILKYNNYGGMIIYNLWPIISTDPSVLNSMTDAEKSFDNHPWLNSLEDQIHPIIFAWGVPGKKGNQYTDKVKGRAFCFGKNKDGSPKHPLYLKNETKIQRY